MRDKSEQPLQVVVEGGALVISIGSKTLSYALEISEANNPFDDAANDFKKLYRVTNKNKFVEEVRLALYAEREDGSTILMDLLDKACWNAIESGCEGIKEIEESQ